MTSSKTSMRYSKKCTKNRCDNFNEVLWLIKMKIRLKMKMDHDIDRPRPKHGYKYIKFEICLSMMMVMCNKKHPTIIWSSIHEKVKQH